MACCFCAVGLTEHAARDPETLRREVESTYRQLSRRTHPDRVGLAFPSQDFLFLTAVKDRCLAKIMQRETKCTLFEHKVRGGGFTPPPTGGGLTPPPAASYSGAGAAPPWAKADGPPWAAGSNNHGTTQQPNTWAVTNWLTRGNCTKLQEEMRERRWCLGRKNPWANCWCPECSKNW